MMFDDVFVPSKADVYARWDKNTRSNIVSCVDDILKGLDDCNCFPAEVHVSAKYEKIASRVSSLFGSRGWRAHWWPLVEGKVLKAIVFSLE
jgi:hypothetical protein